MSLRRVSWSMDPRDSVSAARWGAANLWLRNLLKIAHALIESLPVFEVPGSRRTWPCAWSILALLITYIFNLIEIIICVYCLYED